MNESLPYQKVVLYSDYDCTLTTPDDIFPEENLQAIRRLIAGGGTFALATGKGLSHYRDMDIPCNAPLIFGNGSEVYEPLSEEFLWRRLLPEGSSKLIRRIYDEFPRMGLVAGCFDDSHFYRDRPPLLTPANLPDFAGYEDIETSGELEGRLISINVCLTPEEEEPLRELVAAEFDGLNPMVSYPGFMNITAPNVSKGTALNRLRTEWEPFAGKVILAVGDNENDLEMIKAADIGFAVGNAVAQLQDAADVVLQPSYDPTIAQILRYIDEHGVGSN